jgi:hypothetical protein
MTHHASRPWTADDGIAGVMVVVVASAAAALLVGTLFVGQLLSASADRVTVAERAAAASAARELDAVEALLGSDPYLLLTGGLPAGATLAAESDGRWRLSATVEGPSGPVTAERLLRWASVADVTATATDSDLALSDLWSGAAVVDGATLHAAGAVRFDTDEVMLERGWVAADPPDGRPPYLLGADPALTVAVYTPDPPASQPDGDVRQVADRPSTGAIRQAAGRLTAIGCAADPALIVCVDAVAAGPVRVSPTEDGLTIAEATGDGWGPATPVGHPAAGLVVASGPVTVGCDGGCDAARPLTIVAGAITVESDLRGIPVGLITAGTIEVPATAGERRTVVAAAAAAGGLVGTGCADRCAELVWTGSVTAPSVRISGDAWSVTTVPYTGPVSAWLPGRAVPWQRAGATTPLN